VHTYFEGKGKQLFWLGLVCGFIGIIALYAIIIAAFEIGEGR
jgi:hypothetical protein